MGESENDMSKCLNEIQENRNEQEINVGYADHIQRRDRIIKGKRSWNNNANKTHSLSNENLSISITDHIEDRIPGIEVELRKWIIHLRSMMNLCLCVF